MITVMVARKNSGNAGRGENVSFDTDGFFGGVMGRQSTDDRGEVSFPNVNPCNGEVLMLAFRPIFDR
jgi:hypothetical protein